MFFGKYNHVTGVFEAIASCPDFMLDAQEPDHIEQSIIEMPEHSWLYYVDISTTPHEVKPKQELSVSISKAQISADGIDTTTLSNIPNPTTVTWPDGIKTEVTDGEIVFGVDLVGIYSFEFESVAYLTHSLQIEAV
jgi:hypothetical protein